MNTDIEILLDKTAEYLLKYDASEEGKKCAYELQDYYEYRPNYILGCLDYARRFAHKAQTIDIDEDPNEFTSVANKAYYAWASSMKTQNENMKKNKIRITESELKQIVEESVKKVISELDFKTFPKGDYRERNEWWKTQTNNDFPNFRGDSKDWQSTYNSLESEKRAKESEISKIVKKEWCKPKNIHEVLTGDDVSYDGIMELPLVTNDFELVTFNIDSFTKPLGRNDNFMGIVVGYGGFIKETREQCEITLKVKVSKTDIKVKIITNCPDINTTFSTNEVVKTIRKEAMDHCKSKIK